MAVVGGLQNLVGYAVMTTAAPETDIQKLFIYSKQQADVGRHSSQSASGVTA
jgi:hypothetical protein